jgi:hypothetical protein
MVLNSHYLWPCFILNYTGLGTSTAKEAKEYFADMERHRILFRYAGPEDDAAITLVSILWIKKNSFAILFLLYVSFSSFVWEVSLSWKYST